MKQINNIRKVADTYWPVIKTSKIMMEKITK